MPEALHILLAEAAEAGNGVGNRGIIETELGFDGDMTPV